MYSYFPIVIAIGIATLNSPNGDLSLESGNSQSFQGSQVIAQASSTVETSPEALPELSFAELLSAANQAESDLNYLQAIEYFRQALTLNPEDTAVQEALTKAVDNGFDYYMEAGLVADRERDYQTALKQFQSALKIKPDSDKAQQAVNNVNYYVSLNNQPANNQSESLTEDEPKTKPLNKKFLLSAIAITSIFSVGLLFSLFKKVEIKTNEETSDLQKNNNSNQENNHVLDDDETILYVPDSSSTNSADHQNSSQQPESDDTVIVSPNDASVYAAQPHSQDSPDPFAVTSEASSPTEDLVAELIPKLTISDHKFRHQAINALAQSGDSRAMSPLVELMIEADSQERSLIIDAMQEITSSILKPMNRALILSLGDENSQVKQNAIRDLTRIYEVMLQVTERLSQTINDSEQKLPETAQWALKQLKQMPETPTSQLTNLINN